MITDNAFTQAAHWLRAATKLTEPQARGALRLALKQGGLSADSVTPPELAVVFRRLMPDTLVAQGLAATQAKTIAEQIAVSLEQMPTSHRSEAAMFMFERLDRER